jgi:ABC-type multidrug transport system fused ATPase/permease subunit
MLLELPFKMIVGRHRLGVFEDAVLQRIVEARAEFQRRFADRKVVDFFDPERFSSALSIQDNILFGRPVWDQANAHDRVVALVREMAGEVGLREALMRRGLEFDVGAGGARLTYAQKQQLAIARGLMKNPDVLVLNEPTSGLDPSIEQHVMRSLLGWAKDRTVVWALGRADLAEAFDRVLVLEGGKLVEAGKFQDLERSGHALPRLLAA